MNLVNIETLLLNMTPAALLITPNVIPGINSVSFL